MSTTTCKFTVIATVRYNNGTTDTQEWPHPTLASAVSHVMDRAYQRSQDARILGWNASITEDGYGWRAHFNF